VRTVGSIHPDLVRTEPEIVPGHPDRVQRKDAQAALVLKERTLTNLYNERPQWLADAHRDLDFAAARAYGWPSDISDEDALANLLALNLGQAEPEETPEDAPEEQTGEENESLESRLVPRLYASDVPIKAIPIFIVGDTVNNADMNTSDPDVKVAEDRGSAPEVAGAKGGGSENGRDARRRKSFRGTILFPDNSAFFTFWLGIATLLATLALGINQLRFLSRSVDVAAQSAQAAKQSAEIARDTLVASNRPWVSLFRPSIESALTWDKQGARVTVGVRFKNIGKSPAFDTEIGIGPLYTGGSDVGLRNLCYSLKQGQIARDRGPEKFTSVLFPDELEARSRDLLIARNNDAERARGALICVDYGSRITGQYHSTGLAYFFSKPGMQPGLSMMLTPDEVLNSNEWGFAQNPIVSLAD
jgi:hypothetical protein